MKLFDDPKLFATDYPMPTLALDAPDFGAQNRRRGSNWVEMSWLPVLGLKRQGCGAFVKWSDLPKQAKFEITMG